jgi:hypothetical protein
MRARFRAQKLNAPLTYLPGWHGPIADSIPPGVPGDVRIVMPGDPTQETLPEGHRVKGNSTLLDGNGEVDARWVKTERDSDDPPAHAVVPEGHLVTKVSSFLDGQGKVRAQWVQAPQDKVSQWRAIEAAMARVVDSYKGIGGPAQVAPGGDPDLLTVYAVGDAHIGMLAWPRETGDKFDLRIAEYELVAGIERLVERTPPSKRATFLNLGDWFHVQGDDQLTPHGGNKLDADSRFGKIAEVGLRIQRRCVDLMLRKHDRVHVVNVPGNHDPQASRWLALYMGAVYEQEPRVTIADNSAPYQYEVHGKNLLGYFHGDGAKLEAMPGIMATDRPTEWGNSLYRTWLGGHVHHKIRKELHGASVETFNTLAPKDAWHGWKGYRASQSITAITFDAEYGESTRVVVDIRLIKALSAS